MIVFGSDLWQKPDDYTPPVLHHDDPLVMAIAKVLADTDPDGMGKWDNLIKDAQHNGTHREEYYAEPYGRQVERYIAQAVAVRKLFP